MIKLVVSDIDGTLLPEGTDQINPELFEVIRALKKRGVLFAVASGRQYASMRRVFEPVADEVYFIAENGANVMLRGENLSSSYMDRALAEEVVRYLRTLPDCETALSVPETMYVETKDSRFLDLLLNGYHMNVTYTEDLIPLCSQTIKLCVYRGDGIAPVQNQILERFSDRLNTMVSGEWWVDFMGLTVDKGSALAKLQRDLGITCAETVVFGDNCNDIGMLKCAEESYAVANAHPEAQKAAKHIAPANTEDGVLRTLREIFRL